MPVKPGTLRFIPPIERCWRGITTQPDLASYLTDTIGISLPVPGLSENTLEGFYYQIDREVTPPLIDPLVRFTGQVTDCSVVEVHVVPEHTELFPGVSRVFIPAVETKAIPDSAYTQFYEALQPLLSRYAIRQHSGEDGQIYLEWLHQFVAPCFDAFYYALNPDFFDWLGIEPRHVS
jgi:hypothetical protein